MNCTICGHVLTCPRCTGKQGGESRKVRKGFADWGPDAQAKARNTRRKNRLAELLAVSKAVRRA